MLGRWMVFSLLMLSWPAALLLAADEKPDPRPNVVFIFADDPQEMNSVYRQQAYAETQQALETELARLRQQWQAPAQDPPDSYAPKQRQQQQAKVKQ